MEIVARNIHREGYEDEKEVRCTDCGCFENECDLIDGRCDDCHEDFIEDCEEDEEDELEDE